jgi:hypothetical protein
LSYELCFSEHATPNPRWSNIRIGFCFKSFGRVPMIQKRLPQLRCALPWILRIIAGTCNWWYVI